ncbi:MAG: hypothetical protein A2Z16_03905 [Chloroflexi bacterium RBG_16_54_18]|nr:MAG: hypothetical protein A2Z16_03905 [Chloroflexi bacterium RBG_16_54_18]
MVHTLVLVKCEDFEKWWAVFQESSNLRKSFGSQGAQVFRVQGEPGAGVILAEYADLEKAKSMFQSQEYRQAIQHAGVIGIPEVRFLDEVGKLAA